MATWPDRGVAPTLPTMPTVPIQQPTSASAFPEEHQGRAAGLLRRLSLGGALGRVCTSSDHVTDLVAHTLAASQPQLPVVPKAPSPPTTPMAGHPLERTATVSGVAQPHVSPSPRKARRSNTLAPGTARPPRAPSPMGERILKGHFDGFN